MYDPRYSRSRGWALGQFSAVEGRKGLLLLLRTLNILNDLSSAGCANSWHRRWASRDVGSLPRHLEPKVNWLCAMSG